MTRIIAVGGAVVLLVLAFSCSGDGEGGSDDSTSTGATATVTDVAASTAACDPARPHAVGDSDRTIDSNGLARTYILHVPRSYDGSARAPLVLALHGYAASAASFRDYTQVAAVADREGFIVVFPDGAGSPLQWNQQAAAGQADDVAFIRDLLAELDGELCIDAARTYAAGYSNGGGMAMRLACELADRIAAVGVVAAVFTNCRAEVPLIWLHGTGDAFVPFEGQAPEQGVALPPVRRTVSEWARELGCDGLPVISQPDSEIELSTFTRCAGGDGAVLLYTIIAGGHTWPGASDDDELGQATQQVDASERLWEFFEQRTGQPASD